MDILAERLDTKLRHWRPDIARKARQSIQELIDLADLEAIEMMRSRSVEQEVLDMLDEPEIR
uniref:Uncharacterized protein n=1 Tax=Candidatus Kentrum sp. SD TaxID=2126332 RepID=A0A450Y7X6_9GAMM|nr:MAG: hypothetical protein BECKSD772F_GA0070984_101723 [Candidatus Kentron sp. SD]VFK41300.1 MAG: hypothetical protein BECKSD772E_GA0070983_101118 [Candidatus Kentron sp. SD]